MARAGPSRTQRSQRAPRPSQSQSQRPARGGRRAAIEDDEEEHAGDDDDQDMDINGSQGRAGDAEAELDRKASDLVRFALFMEQKRTLIRREDINKKVLASNSRSFNHVLERAQKLLKKTFAMELVELQSRNYREQDVVAGDDLQEARNATGVRRKVTAAAGSKTYILRSVLDPVIIEEAARTDERLYEEQIADSQEDGDDDDDMPRSYGCIISWSTTDQLGALGVLHTILSLILVSGRSMTDLDLHTYLNQLVKQGYLDRINPGETKAPGKRSRAPAATQANPDETQAFEWHWGHRSYSEIGEQAVATFIAEFMVERNRDDDIEEDDQEDDKKLKNVFGVIERAAGGNLSDIK
ncbi:MAGE-domain-containing protein [Suillus paluster]|uniref:MAGE-domain-containing protein n=1 Tax=Suillus paluster TaxID=48578 RepID=UPI001B879F2E|nr:MAGE-domain-containing protein [Suillus paluster]KAG1745033.1 MAGE-domain-containing protein [Suillus paluster]